MRKLIMSSTVLTNSNKLTQKSAAATTVLSRVLMQGTKEHPDKRSYASALEDAYGAQVYTDVSKLGETQLLCVGVNWLKDKYAMKGESVTKKALSLCLETAFLPNVSDGAFMSDVVKREKMNAVDDVLSLINNKAAYAKIRLKEIMCKDEAYSISPLGKTEEIKKLTGKKLFGFYNKMMKESPVEIFFAGQADLDTLTGMLKDAFSSVERDVCAAPKTKIIKSVSEAKEANETMPINQASLVMGYRTGITYTSKNYHAAALYNAILGGSLTSKLFMNVREKLSLCYTVSSAFDFNKGIMQIYSGIDLKNREKAKDEIFFQIDEIKKGNISEREMLDAKAAIINAINSLEDTPSAMASYFLPRILSGKAIDLEADKEKFISLTKKDVMNVSKYVFLDTVYTLSAGE